MAEDISLKGQGTMDLTLIGASVDSLVPGAAWSAIRQQGGHRARVYRVDWHRGKESGRFAARLGENCAAITRLHRICTEILPFINAASPRTIGLFAGEGCTLSATEWVEGIPLSRGQKVDCGALMDVLAAQHRESISEIPERWRELCWDYGLEALSGAFESLLRVLDVGLQEASQPQWLDREFVMLAGRLGENADTIAAGLCGGDKTWVHGDAVPGNILYSTSSSGFVLIDWEQFGLYLPHLDVLSALYHYRDEDRAPLVQRYLRSKERWTGQQTDIREFLHMTDFVDLQRSAEIVALWYGKALSGEVPIEVTGGFLARRASALKTAAGRLGFLR